MLLSSVRLSTKLRSICTRNASTVGFVGVGNMGANMVANLLKNGHKVVAYDLNRQALESVTANGATAAASVADVAKQSDKVITMLPTPDIVKATYRGADGIIANSPKGSILIDSSTVGPDAPRELAPEAQARGLTFVDAPVTGAVPAARAGTLTFLVGGTEAECAAVKDVLLAMGKHVVHCGSTGSGQVAKICNNMCLAINMISTAETLALAERLGLSAKLMTDILNISSGRSWCSEIYNPAPNVAPNVPSNNNYEGGFMVELIAKDLTLVQHSASKVKAPLPLGGQALQVYTTMSNNGMGRKDFSSVFQFIQKK